MDIVKPAGGGILRLGFMEGQIRVPDDLDRMGSYVIERLFSRMDKIRPDTETGKMYLIDEHDRVAKLDDIPKPVTGTPEPIVVADEHAVVLSYVTEYPESQGGLDELLCQVRFHCALTHLFGSPNDEALEGHPLWKRGLDFYGVFQVHHSSLIRRLAAMNSVHIHHSYAAFDDLVHYIFTFHDSTFECVARSYETVIERIPWDKRHEKAAELLRRRPPADISRFVKTDPVAKFYRWLPPGFRFLLDVFHR